MEDREDRVARQRLSAILTLETMAEGGAQLRPMMEVTGGDGDPAVLIGWPGRGQTPRDRAVDLAVALSVAALYEPTAVCLVLPARMKLAQPEELPSSYDEAWLRDDPGARECLIIIRSNAEESRMEILPYGRGDDGRLRWDEAPTGMDDHILPRGDPMAISLNNFWSDDCGLWPPGWSDPEGRQLRLVAARVYLPGLQVYDLKSEHAD